MANSLLAELGRRNRHNLGTLRARPAAEISGALGDLGTLLPLMMALALQGSIDLPATLVFSGLFNIATGVVFGVPLPVQPMKAIAASALSSHAPQPAVTASGALVSVAVLFLSATGLIGLLARLVPPPVIRGIQLGAGLRLMTATGAALILPLPWLLPLPDSRLAAAVLAVFLCLTRRLPRFPSALVLFLLGLAAACLSSSPPPPTTLNSNPAPNPHHHSQSTSITPTQTPPAFLSPAALTTALAQLPLTTLNSVLAASALAAHLLPAFPVSAPALGVSVGLMNLASCRWGAMPVCHGSGGLAAQHRFGARSGASVVLLGLVKLAAGLFLLLLTTTRARAGDGVGVGVGVGAVGRFPRAVLGVMVLAAGLELAWAGTGAGGRGEGGEGRQGLGDDAERRKDEWTVMMVTAAGTLAFRNDAVGFLAGVVCHESCQAAEWVEGRWGERWSESESESESGERRALLH